MCEFEFWHSSLSWDLSFTKLVSSSSGCEFFQNYNSPVGDAYAAPSIFFGRCICSAQRNFIKTLILFIRTFPAFSSHAYFPKPAQSSPGNFKCDLFAMGHIYRNGTNLQKVIKMWLKTHFNFFQFVATSK